MSEYRDESITCSSCGTDFVFSADEAQHFAQKKLQPPKRCRECRKLQKQARGAGGGGSPQRSAFRGGGGPARSPRGPRAFGSGGPGNRGPARYTGDVNEYRSPMQDSSSWSWNTVYAQNSRSRNAVDDNRGNVRPQSGGNERGDRGPQAARPRKQPRTREMFDITCTSCGTQTQVPFKPADGRDVFCQPCYRARKPGAEEVKSEA